MEGVRQIRKVQEVGGGTLVISLPKEWAVRVGLQKGSEVVAQEAPGGLLLIYPLSATVRIGCSARHVPGQVGNTLDSILEAYLEGCDVLEVECSGRLGLEDRRAIKKLLASLVGSEIVEEGEGILKVQFLVDLDATDPHGLLERMIRSAGNMLLDAITAISLGDNELANLVIERDDEIDRTYFLLVRALRKAAQDVRALARARLSPMILLDLRVAALIAEGIADMAVDVASLARKGVRVDIIDLKLPFKTLFSLLAPISRGRGTDSRVERIREINRLISDRLLRMVEEGGGGTMEAVVAEKLMASSRAALDLADLFPSRGVLLMRSRAEPEGY